MVLINEIIGSLRKYQIWIFCIVSMSKFGVALHQMAIIFLAPPVQYFCPSKEDCCDDPVYNRTEFSRTIVMEWNLICGRSWMKVVTQMLFQFGVLCGSLLCGMASDRFGRRPTLVFCVILEVFAGLMTSFLPDYWSFTIVRMILGFSLGGVSVVGFVIVMEYVGNNYRDKVAALYHVPFTAGHISLALFGYLAKDYVYFQLGISLSTVILLTYICFLPESPRWLLAVNKITEAVTLMERIAEINKLPVDQIQTKINTYQLEHKSYREKKGTAADLFRTPNLRKNIFVMSFTWFALSYCFYGLSQYISHLTGNIYVNVVATGSFSLCACIFAIPLMSLIGKKTLVIVSNLACSVFVLVIAFIPEGNLCIVIGCIAIFFCYISFIVVYLYCTEMFPTVVRNAALGITSMSARVGSMIAPYVAELRPYGKWCAPVAFAIFPLIAAGLCCLLPETRKCELIMTIEEGEAFGKRPPTRTDNNTPTDAVT